MSLDKLVAVSNRYGANEEYVIAGGGNTSWKTDEYMYVKGSGTELATIKADGFVKVKLQKLDTIWSKKYSDDPDKREEEVLIDLMASRYLSEMEKRPSVETLLHALLPYSFVVHTHPALVNGITCSKKGEETVKELFGDRAIWVPITNPGYILAKKVKDKIQKHTNAGKEFPLMIFLQNHGVFVSGNSIDEIDGIYKKMFDSIKNYVDKFPVITEVSVSSENIEIAEKTIKGSLGKDIKIIAFTNSDIFDMSTSEEAFAPLRLSMTPDHIVYYGFKPVFTKSLQSLGQDISNYVKENDVNPRLAVVKGIGAFAFSTTVSLTEKAKKLFLDDVKVAVYTESFGGFQFMPKDKIDFIRNWEVEKYRVSLSK